MMLTYKETDDGYFSVNEKLHLSVMFGFFALVTWQLRVQDKCQVALRAQHDKENEKQVSLHAQVLYDCVLGSLASQVYRTSLVKRRELNLIKFPIALCAREKNTPRRILQKSLALLASKFKKVKIEGKNGDENFINRKQHKLDSYFLLWKFDMVAVILWKGFALFFGCVIYIFFRQINV